MYCGASFSSSAKLKDSVLGKNTGIGFFLVQSNFFKVNSMFSRVHVNILFWSS